VAEITKIFVDLDDTLNAFTMSALAEVGCPVGPFDFGKFDPAWGMDIVLAANELHPSRTFSKQEFWDSLSNRFWRHVPPSKECWEIINSCAGFVGQENVCILTAFYPDFEQPHVASAKSQWICGFLPLWLHDNFLIGPNKTHCASPNALLVDDSDENVNAFRAAGGHAILLPRPWNSLHFVPTIKHFNMKIGQAGEW